ncbi:unnamed protein product, partial [Candidula unifasciata]
MNCFTTTDKGMAAVIKVVTIRKSSLWRLLGSIFVLLLVLSSIYLESWKIVTTNIHYIPFGISASVSLGKTQAQDITDAEHLRQIARKVQVAGVNCEALLDGDKNEIKAALSLKTNASIPLMDSFYLNITTNCTDFQKQRGYIMSSLTNEERNFSIAFSVMVYKDAEMVERLLRAIYRPHNVYCIHVDYKSPLEFFRAISAIANCFPNVFIASKRVDVRWGTFTVLEPELICMEELWRYRKWKYFINLTGQEFPLKTNYELVKILTAYNGSVD